METKHSVEIMKTGHKRSSAEMLSKQVAKIISRAMSEGRTKRGWKITIEGNDWHIPKLQASEFRWLCKLNVTCNKERTAEAIAADFDNIIKYIGSAGAIPGWQIAFIDGRTADAKKDKRLPTALGYVPVEIPDDWSDRFSHIYERENQIEIIMSALQAGITSNFANRFHCALIGDPSCGKTETLRAVKAVVGPDAVMEYDATATTQAGAIKDLNERDELPRILIVEEIEKTDPDSLRWLLGAMDHRAEIRKVTAREQIQRETRMLTLATVNDYPLFLKIMYGALASRFTYHLHFPKPNEKLLIRILTREIDRVKGKKAWIKPALEYAKSEGIYDPRKVCAICLCGKDDLLDGSYQLKLKECAPSNFLREIEKRNAVLRQKMREEDKAADKS